MEGQLVRLRPRTTEDVLEDERRIQNDPELALLDPSAGTVVLFLHLSIETLGQHYLGACALYNYENTSLQLGIRINDRNYWGQGYGTEAIGLLVDYGFTFYVGISRIWVKVLPTNPRAIRCYEKCGFVQCGRLLLGGYDFIMMEVTRVKLCQEEHSNPFPIQ